MVFNGFQGQITFVRRRFLRSKWLVVHGEDGDAAMLRAPLLVEHLALHCAVNRMVFD